MPDVGCCIALSLMYWVGVYSLNMGRVLMQFRAYTPHLISRERKWAAVLIRKCLPTTYRVGNASLKPTT
jgi:hypothetical protein